MGPPLQYCLEVKFPHVTLYFVNYLHMNVKLSWCCRQILEKGSTRNDMGAVVPCASCARMASWRRSTALGR